MSLAEGLDCHYNAVKYYLCHITCRANNNKMPVRLI